MGPFCIFAEIRSNSSIKNKHKQLMSNSKISAAAFADTKPHYDLLDGLRGVAALMVIFYHVFEAFATSPIDQRFNHGYLAVDFFFILSGFVISYAYDDRIRNTITLKNFFKRRLIRLHPMVIIGAVIGAVTFIIQGSVRWDGTHVATSAVMVALLCAMFFIPAVPGASNEVRGNGEMFPLNGPSWSLFFEYIGNIMYALFICSMSKKALRILTIFLGLMLCAFTLSDFSGYGCLSVGWTLNGVNFIGGLLRMLFPFSLGMLIHRNFKPLKIGGAFWICSIVLLLLFFVPFIPGVKPLCFNGLYEMFCIAIVFPLLAWLIRNKYYTFGETWQVAICLVIINVILAYVCLKFYDEPVRKWLAKRFLN